MGCLMGAPLASFFGFALETRKNLAKMADASHGNGFKEPDLANTRKGVGVVASRSMFFEN